MARKRTSLFGCQIKSCFGLFGQVLLEEMLFAISVAIEGQFFNSTSPKATEK